MFFLAAFIQRKPWHGHLAAKLFLISNNKCCSLFSLVLRFYLRARWIAAVDACDEKGLLLCAADPKHYHRHVLFLLFLFSFFFLIRSWLWAFLLHCIKQMFSSALYLLCFLLETDKSYNLLHFLFWLFSPFLSNAVLLRKLHFPK